MKVLKLVSLAALLGSSAATAKPPSEAKRLSRRAATITIARDQYGIAHIRGRTDADAVFGIDRKSVV